jgi:hypothetical protein
MGLFGGVLFFFIVEDFSLSFKSLALEVIEIPDVSDIAHDVCSSPVVNGGGGGISGTFGTSGGTRFFFNISFITF